MSKFWSEENLDKSKDENNSQRSEQKQASILLTETMGLKAEVVRLEC